MQSKKKKKRRKTKLPKLKVDKQSLLWVIVVGSWVIMVVHGRQLSIILMTCMNFWGSVWLMVSQGWLTLLLLDLCPGSTLRTEHNQAVHFVGRMWEKGRARVPVPLEGWSPVAQLLPDRPHLPEVPPSSPSSAKVWKPGLNTWASWRHSEPQTLAEWKVGGRFLDVSLTLVSPFILSLLGQA